MLTPSKIVRRCIDALANEGRRLGIGYGDFEALLAKHLPEKMKIDAFILNFVWNHLKGHNEVILFHVCNSSDKPLEVRHIQSFLWSKI